MAAAPFSNIMFDKFEFEKVSNNSPLSKQKTPIPKISLIDLVIWEDFFRIAYAIIREIVPTVTLANINIVWIWGLSRKLRNKNEEAEYPAKKNKVPKQCKKHVVAIAIPA